MVSEIATAGGTFALIGLMWRFLNAKTDKKQEKEMCKQIHGGIENTLSDMKQESHKIFNTLVEIKEDNAAIKNELKHLNGKSLDL